VAPHGEPGLLIGARPLQPDCGRLPDGRLGRLAQGGERGDAALGPSPFEFIEAERALEKMVLDM